MAEPASKHETSPTPRKLSSLRIVWRHTSRYPLQLGLAIVALIPVLGQLVALVVNIAVMVSSVFVGIKRLHDRNKTGWWLLPYYFVPMILFGISFYLGYMADEATPLSMLTSLLGLAAMLWVFVDLGCLRGTIGPNQYGPDPVAPALATH